MRCRGPCEGVGVYPMRFEEWDAMKPRGPFICPQLDDDDKWESFPPENPRDSIFVVCDLCHGTGIIELGE